MPPTIQTTATEPKGTEISLSIPLPSTASNPQDWLAIEGRPEWLLRSSVRHPEGHLGEPFLFSSGSWALISDGFEGPDGYVVPTVCMPRMGLPIPASATKAQKLKRPVRAALLRDYFGWGREEIGAWMNLKPDSTRSSGIPAGVDRAIDDGRCLLVDAGVMPWKAMDDEEVPQPWWRDRRFAEAMSRWSTEPPESQVFDSPEVEAEAGDSDADRRARESRWHRKMSPCYYDATTRQVVVNSFVAPNHDSEMLRTLATHEGFRRCLIDRRPSIEDKNLYEYARDTLARIEAQPKPWLHPDRARSRREQADALVQGNSDPR